MKIRKAMGKASLPMWMKRGEKDVCRMRRKIDESIFSEGTRRSP
jgi:hypothetical protein